MNTNEIRQVFFDHLIADEQLMALLPANSNWQSLKGRKLSSNSIVPVNQFNPKNIILPALTFQLSADVNAGLNKSVSRLFAQSLFIRCYNASDKTYVSIDEILSRVIDLLHRQSFTLDSSVSVQTVYLGSSAELTDQAFNLPYREAQFEMLRLA